MTATAAQLNALMPVVRQGVMPGETFVGCYIYTDHNNQNNGARRALRKLADAGEYIEHVRPSIHADEYRLLHRGWYALRNHSPNWDGK